MCFALVAAAPEPCSLDATTAVAVLEATTLLPAVLLAGADVVVLGALVTWPKNIVSPVSTGGNDEDANDEDVLVVDWIRLAIGWLLLTVVGRGGLVTCPKNMESRARAG